MMTFKPTSVVGSTYVVRALKLPNNAALTRLIQAGSIEPAGRLGDARNSAYFFDRDYIDRIASEWESGDE